MTPNKSPSLLSELLTWIGSAGLSLVLALPLIICERRLDVDRLAAEFLAAPPVSEAAVQAGRTNLPPQTAGSSHRLAFLNPDHDLLKNLNDRSRSRPAFSRGARAYEEIIEDTARQHRVSPVLVKAVIQAESSFNPGAISHKGAVGLMQVMPTTARQMGVHDPQDPHRNIVAGVKYLKMLLEMFNDDERLAIAAYNCGPDALTRHNNQIPPYPETRAFVNKVMNYYNQHLES